ncbi:MAG: glutamine--tRNA ligase/YqeY domain fusion protein [Chitinophagaceae bacterium]
MSEENILPPQESSNFIDDIIKKDVYEKKYPQGVLTRFPPEPNGYLHIGHAKSMYLNFGLAQKYNGKTNLRFDDTNPSTEDTKYVESIKQDIQWLGFQWSNEFYTSDYFNQLYKFALILIKKGLAYIDDSTPEEIAHQKGTPVLEGEENPYRERSVEENLTLFEAMRKGKFKEGEKTLRAKIDMTSPNMHMRDPIMYRIKYAHHHRTGNEWCIYPMYDFAHGQSDAIEHITHSICTLEFLPHRELYDWYIQKLNIFHSKQYEFARLNMTYSVMSKRKMLQLVQGRHVTGWDDPRMPTISGMRRRGFTPESIRVFCDKIGIQKRETLIDYSLLEFCVRDHLNKIALRRMVVFDPIKVVITNYEENKVEILKIENNPEDENITYREITFSREIYIEREDFIENPPKKYFRLAVGQMVRLKSAYIICCDEVLKDNEGNIQELRCLYIPESKSGHDTSGIKVKGTLHWVNIQNAIEVEIQLYDRLFSIENLTTQEDDFTNFLNPQSLKIIKKAFAEPILKEAILENRFQFMRKGYFCLDKDSSPSKLIFNRTVTLKDSWTKINTK